MKKTTWSWVAALLCLNLALVQADLGTGNKVGQKMPDFTLLDQNANDTTFYSVVKGKKTLVYFFMGCCNHCVALLPKLSDVAQDVQKRGIAVVGVQYFGNTAFCKFTMNKHKIIGTVFADSKGEVCGRMGVGEFTTMTLDEQGVIQYRGNNVDNVDKIKKSLNI